MIENDIQIRPEYRTEIIRFLNTGAGHHMLEILESQAPGPEQVPAVGGTYAPPHIYQLRAGVTQGYIDCLYNLREIPNLQTNTETESENTIETQED